MSQNASRVTQVRHDAENAAALFPALLAEAERIAQTIASGLHGRRQAGTGETFWQHRPYAFGDPVNSIDWRQSARMNDRLFVRQNEWEAPASIYIWRDPSRSLDYSSQTRTQTKSHRSNILALALTILLSKAGERISILGKNQRPFQGRTAPMKMLEALDIGTFKDGLSLPPPANPTPGSRVVLISDFYNNETAIEKSVRALSATGAVGVLLQICDPAEEEFPFSGRVEFEDFKGPDRLIFGNAGTVAENYKAKFSAHRDALKHIASQSGWTFIAHRTDHTAQTALLALFKALVDQKIQVR